MSTPMINFPPFRPYTNITPFTVRDGATYLTVLEELRNWLNTALVPHVDTEVANLVIAWEDNANTILSTVTNQLELQNADILAQLNAQNDAITAQLSDQDAEIAAQINNVTAFINQSIADIQNSVTSASNSATAASNSEINAHNSELNAEIYSQNVMASYNNIAVNAGNPIFGGLVSDGDITAGTGTDNYNTFLNALVAARQEKRALYIPDGIYRISQTLPWDGVIYGNGPDSVTIWCDTPNIPIVATRSWLTEYSGSPSGRSSITGIQFVGAGKTSGANGHGIVLRDFYTRIENIVIHSVGGNPINFTHISEDGVSIASTLVENRIHDVELRNFNGTGIYLGNSDNNKLTDGSVINAYIDCSGANSSVYCGSSAGWYFDDIHSYGTPTGSAINLRNCYSTSIGRLYVEAYGSAQAALYAHVQSDLNISDISAVSNGSNVISIDRSAAYPNSVVHIGMLSIRHDINAPGIAVRTVSQYLKVYINSWKALGSYAQLVKLEAGTLNENKVYTPTGLYRSPDNKIYTSLDDGTLVKLANAGSVLWNGNDSKNISIPVMPISSYAKRTGIISIVARDNHNGAISAKWVGHVWISAKNNGVDTWTIVVTDIIIAAGFSVNPTISAINTTGDNGQLSISFTANSANAYGDVSFISN